MSKIQRTRRFVAIVIAALFLGAIAVVNTIQTQQTNTSLGVESVSSPTQASSPALETLQILEIKGRAPKTGYSRQQFGDGWANIGGCDTRNIVLRRDLTDVKLAEDNCTILSGTLNDPYTGKSIGFTRGQTTSDDVQIDHVVALSDAWQKGAQQLPPDQRQQFANDSLNLLAVDGPTNQKKGDGDAATWLPPNKPYRCQYIARQIAVKAKYHLWTTQAEHNAMQNILTTCPAQKLPIET